MQRAAPLLQLAGISKSFGSVRANRDVSLTLRRGQIHALVGENGAGKTTLMRILYGMVQPDSGSVALEGRRAQFASPRDALSAGVVMVQQSFALVGQFSVVENVVLGDEPTTRCSLLDKATACDAVARLAARLGISIDPMARVADLGTGMLQRVEILKALYRGARVLILDEPTSLLGPRETDELFSVMRELAREGTGIVFISHRVREVLQISDRITVLRRGRKVAEVDPADTTAERLSVLMAGGKATSPTQRAGDHIMGQLLLRLDDVHACSADGAPVLTGVSLEVRSGEILGIAAVEGNGARELVEAVIGSRPLTAGAIRFRGRDGRVRTADLRRGGMGIIPEDPRLGVVNELSLAENVLLGREWEPLFSRFGLLRRPALLERCRAVLARFGIVPADPRIPAMTLSGGNRQRLVVARELDRRPDLVVAAHPTKGLDVAGADFVRNTLVEERNRGGAVLLVSSDLDELLELSDRVAVLFRGSVVATFPNDGLREADVIPYMTGARGTATEEPGFVRPGELRRGKQGSGRPERTGETGNR